MNILVTGGAGYVGSHACKALAAKGYVPITYDNLSRGNLWAVKWGPFEKGDVADARQVQAALEKYQPAALMHFAAYAYVGESVEQPLRYYANNTVASRALAEACIECGMKNFIFSSTATVYAVDATQPLAETEPTVPISPVCGAILSWPRCCIASNCWP